MTDLRANEIFATLRGEIKKLRQQICCTMTQNGATGTEPTSPYLGELFFDTTLVKLKFWNGSVWAIVTSTP